MFNWRKKLLSSLDIKKQEKALDKNRTVDVGRLISKRLLSRNEDTDSYIGGKLEIDDKPFTEDDRDNYTKKIKEHKVQLPSTAIANARFDEDKGAIYITYVGDSDKEYVFKGNRKTWLSFMNAGSKGRYVQYVMKVMNSAPESWWS